MSDVLGLLRAELGERVDTDPGSLDEARADKSGHRSPERGIAVVHAASVADVQATMRIAHRTGTPVVVRGAGTGLAGGANTGRGEIALSLRSMDRIVEVRADDLLAVVEPGILNAALNERLAAHGLWWAPDPASRDISTVGGNIATGAGGRLCAKYGVVRDAVLGLDVVLADGRLISVGHRSVKGVTGYDLTALMIGSEGTLGVVVGATLKLRRLVPGTTRTLTATFPDVRAAAVASAAVTAAEPTAAVRTSGNVAVRVRVAPGTRRRSFSVAPTTTPRPPSCGRCAGPCIPRWSASGPPSSRTSPCRAARSRRCSTRSPGSKRSSA